MQSGGSQVSEPPLFYSYAVKRPLARELVCCLARSGCGSLKTAYPQRSYISPRCAHAARAPTSTNSSRSRQECRRPFPPAPLSVLMFVYHTDKPCCGHMSEPQQGRENRVGKADAILYESPVSLGKTFGNDRASAPHKLTSMFYLLRRLSDGRLHLACVYVLG